VPSSPASTYVVHLSSAYTGGTGSSSSLSTDFQWVFYQPCSQYVSKWKYRWAFIYILGFV